MSSQVESGEDSWHAKVTSFGAIFIALLATDVTRYLATFRLEVAEQLGISRADHPRKW